MAIEQVRYIVMRLIPLSDSTFHVQLIECRRVLKNSYVRAYFLQDGTPAKQLYEFQQQMLEVNTEELSRLTEKTLSTISEEEAIHIVNLTR